MATQISTGSPKGSRKSTPSIKMSDKKINSDKTPRGSAKAAGSMTVAQDALHQADTKFTEQATPDDVPGVNTILAQLRLNDSRKPTPVQVKHQDHLDKIVANLKDQNKTLKKQQMELRDESNTGSYKDPDRSSSSDAFTPATDSFEAPKNPNRADPVAAGNDAEILRIKRELEAARSVINRQELELAESRNLRHTMEQVMGPAAESDYFASPEISRVPPALTQTAFNVSARPFTSQGDPTWQAIDDSKAEYGSTLVNNTLGRERGFHVQPSVVNTVGGGHQAFSTAHNRNVTTNAAGFPAGYDSQPSQVDMSMVRNRTFSSGSSSISYGIDDRLHNNIGAGAVYHGLRRPETMLRSNSTMSDPLTPISPTSAYGQTLVDPLALGSLAGVGQYNYPDRGPGGQTSPVGGQFPMSAGQGFAGDLSLAGTTFNGQNYIMPAEPMNYRRLLDKSVSCDWKYIVDKIVCNNDQQASIFLQQKLKVGTAEQKYEIVESIVNQAYPLMINRFGNFLVQRCFEHGTPDQVVSIANAIHGNVISLSMDPFGCHVIQKAFDSVPEDHKADMVRELLRRIPDTVIHRYACHVWQKLFELRWSGEPPQIMVKVNEALQGMWHEVALGETGSLVVQNIFENCVEEEKRPAIEEVIANIDLIAHGQFGNWCIQHLCEHGSPPDKRRVVDHILKNSYNYSIDQFASKVVEKCLKIGGPEFLERYLGVITTARPDRPRIPLIDIAGDQYGNYLIQWILMNTHQHQREQVAIHIRKHMVSLRGSKFGSRVAMLCSNPASVTRPGAASALVNPYGAPTQQRLGGRYR